MAAAVVLAGCTATDNSINIKPDGGKDVCGEAGNEIDAVCIVDNRAEAVASRAKAAPLAVRSLIDQITTKQLDSNFLRIDEDVDDDNAGTYTYTRGNGDYAINWEKAKLLEATVISSPDNTQGRHFRSISFNPSQTYNIYKAGMGAGSDPDTTQFHHTRMVGWYPKTCLLQEVDGRLVEADLDHFESAYTTMEVGGRKRVAIKFAGLDGETDLMVSNVREGQRWHKYGAYYTRDEQWVSGIHPSDTNDGENVYRAPFGHHDANPTYENYFTYKHYRSAVRIYAWADKSTQSLSMWGKLENIVLGEQPTACTIVLPDTINYDGEPAEGDFGTVAEWSEKRNIPITCSPIFGDDSNHPEDDLTVEYPISMEGTSAIAPKYLGYSCVQPDAPVRIELHAASGVYGITIPTKCEVSKTVDGVTTTEEVEVFKAGYIYNIYLDLKTDGTIAARLENEGNERYFDLTRLEEFDVAEAAESEGTESQEEKDGIFVYKYANCYVVDPTLRTVGLEAKRAAGEAGFDDGRADAYTLRKADGTYDALPAGDSYYDGYCFSATVVGNGAAGILSSGAQTMYPTSDKIAPVNAHLLWESNLGLITQVELLYGYVRFRVPMDDDENPPRGNAVIAVYDDSGRILWSWHIWITDTPEDVVITPGDASTQTSILDRNLGATRAAWSGADDVLDTYGLYYQWGRKDPSPGPRAYNYSVFDMITAPYYDYASERKTSAEVVNFARPTLRNAVENPLYLILPTEQTGGNYYFNWCYDRYDFLWGQQEEDDHIHKTIYDPCPFGYRVSAGEMSAFFSSYKGTPYATEANFERTDYGMVATTKLGKQVYFPYAGYKGVDIGLNSMVCSWRYVGEKADFQSALIHELKGEKHDGHRGRIYLSKAAKWKEVSGQEYSGYKHDDWTNRRTAASVRCVKDAAFGSIQAFIGLVGNPTHIYPGSTFSVDCDVHSTNSNIMSVKIDVYGYRQKFADYKEVYEQGNKVLITTIFDSATSLDYTAAPSWHKVLESHALDIKHMQGYNLNFAIEIAVANAHGIKYEATVDARAARYTVNADEWNEQNKSEPVMIGQPIDRVLVISGSYETETDSEKLSVRITGADSDGGNAQTVALVDYWSHSKLADDWIYRQYPLGTSDGGASGIKRSEEDIVFYTAGKKVFTAEVSSPVLNTDGSSEKFFADEGDELNVTVLDTKATALTDVPTDSDGKYFAIKPAGATSWLNMSDLTATPTDGKAYYGNLFRLVASGDGYKIMNVATGKYLAGGTSDTASAIACNSAEADAAVYTITANGDGTFGIASGDYAWVWSAADGLSGQSGGTTAWNISTVETVAE